MFSNGSANGGMRKCKSCYWILEKYEGYIEIGNRKHMWIIALRKLLSCGYLVVGDGAPW